MSENISELKSSLQDVFDQTSQLETLKQALNPNESDRTQFDLKNDQTDNKESLYYPYHGQKSSFKGDFGITASQFRAFIKQSQHDLQGRLITELAIQEENDSPFWTPKDLQNLKDALELDQDFTYVLSLNFDELNLVYDRDGNVANGIESLIRASKSKTYSESFKVLFNKEVTKKVSKASEALSTKCNNLIKNLHSALLDQKMADENEQDSHDISR